MKKLLSLGVLCILFVSGCEDGSYVGRGALYGAGTGALIGGLAGHCPEDALTGAALGALGGAILGSLVEEAEYNRYYRGRDYPFARPTRQPGIVISPYEPFHRIDVNGIPPGAYVRDPSSGGIFRVP